MDKALEILILIGFACGLLSLVCIAASVILLIKKDKNKNSLFIITLVLGTVFAIFPIMLFFMSGILLIIIYDIVMITLYLRK